MVILTISEDLIHSSINSLGLPRQSCCTVMNICYYGGLLAPVALLFTGLATHKLPTVYADTAVQTSRTSATLRTCHPHQHGIICPTIQAAINYRRDDVVAHTHEAGGRRWIQRGWTPGAPRRKLKALRATDVRRDPASVAGSCRGGGNSGQPPVPTARGVFTRTLKTAKILTLFILTYVASIGFNVNNKRALNLVPLPWTYAALNLLMGATASFLTWGVKAAPWPRISGEDILTLVPMAFLHMVSHLTVVLGLGAGSVSFVHTVKAAEACFTAAFSIIFQGQILPLPVYLSLVPVVVGVAITSCSQAHFSWIALTTALTSNFSNALRNVLIVKAIGPAAAAAKSNRDKGRNVAAATVARRSPQRSDDLASISSDNNVTTRTRRTILMTARISNSGMENEKKGEKKEGLAFVGPGDTFRLLTTIGAVLLLPVAAAIEGQLWGNLWQGATAAALHFVGRDGAAASVDPVGDWAAAARHAFLAGMFWNAFYELSFRLLGQVHPVTHAVGNTFKRVFVIGAGVLAFGGDLGGARGALGSALAVFGVLGYSIAKTNSSSSI